MGQMDNGYKCFCDRLRVPKEKDGAVVVGGMRFVGLRCPWCVDGILAEKNELVRENALLREAMRVGQREAGTPSTGWRYVVRHDGQKSAEKKGDDPEDVFSAFAYLDGVLRAATSAPSAPEAEIAVMKMAEGIRR